MSRAEQVKSYLLNLQEQIVASLEKIDGKAFLHDSWQRQAGGGGRSCVLEDGAVFERGGVNFSHVCGNTLPPSAACV